MAEFLTGEYLNTRLAPQILREFQNNRADFFAAIPMAPAEAISEEGLRMNLVIDNVDSVINPVDDFDSSDVNEMDIKKGIIGWDYITTKPTKITKEQLRAAVFDKTATVRVMHTESLLRKRRDYAIDKLLPADNTESKLPVLRTTGPTVNGRKRLVVTDLINFLDAVRALDPDDESQFNMVLSRNHVTDLLIDTKDNQPFRDLYFKHKTGEVIDVYGFRFFRNNSNGVYTSAGVKKPLGSAIVAGDQDASLFFYGPNTVMGYGNIGVHVNPIEQDTRSNPPRLEMRITANLLTERKQETLTGAIVSDNA